MHDLGGVSISVGSLSRSEHATTAAVAAPGEEAHASVRTQRTAYPDETPWRQGHQRAWLWVAVTSLVTVLLVRLSRGSQGARDL